MTVAADPGRGTESSADALPCSIIIPTVGRSELLQRVLRALDSQSFPDFEAIIVFDGVAPDSAADEAGTFKFPLRHVYLKENCGQATARNAGVAAARGRVIVFLDDDMIPDPAFVDVMMKHHDVGKVVEPRVVLGRIVEEYEKPPASRLEGWLRARRNEILNTALGAIESGDLAARSYVCCGASCSLPRAVFELACGFRDDLRFVHEDADLGLRLLDAGVPFMVDRSAVVRHQNRKDMLVSFLSGNKNLGSAHVRLAREGNLASPHARRLALLQGNSRSAVLVRNTAHAGSAPRVIENALAKSVEFTGSRRLAEAWRNLAGHRAYIEGIEEQGENPATAARLVRSGPRVLLMHAIGEADSGRARRFSLKPQKLRHICQRMTSAGWTGVTLSSALANPERENQVALTFDDGYEDFIEIAAPILNAFGFKATVYVVSGLIGKVNSWDTVRGRKSRRLLSSSQLRTLVQDGFELGSHSVTHAWLPGLAPDRLQSELHDSKAQLEDTAAAPVSSFAYPSGGVNVRVRLAARDAGYESAATAGDGSNRPLDILAVERWQVDRDHSVGGVMRTLMAGTDHRKSAATRLLAAGREVVIRVGGER